VKAIVRILLFLAAVLAVSDKAFAGCPNECVLDSQSCAIGCDVSNINNGNTCMAFDCTCTFDRCPRSSLDGGSCSPDRLAKGKDWFGDFLAVSSAAERLNGVGVIMSEAPNAPLSLSKMTFSKKVILEAEALSSSRKDIAAFSLSLLVVKRNGEVEILKFSDEIQELTSAYGKIRFNKLTTPAFDNASVRTVLVYISDVSFSDGKKWHANNDEMKAMVRNVTNPKSNVS
jgi:hypothetical protein